MSDDITPDPAGTLDDHYPGRYVTVDLNSFTSDDARTLLATVLEREARELQRRCEWIAQASERLEAPTIGAYRRHSPEVQPPGIEL